MPDAEMPNVDSANIAESSGNNGSIEVPQNDLGELTTPIVEEADEDFTAFESLLADDAHPSTGSPSNEEFDKLTHNVSALEPKEPPKRIPNFSITKFRGIASWGPRDNIYDCCAICRNHVLDNCVDCEIAPPKDGGGCDIAEGLCRHVHHFHCLSIWLRKSSTCPLDNSTWSLYKVTAEGAPG